MDAFQFRQRPENCADPETEELARRMIGAAIEVHRVLGPGLPEGVYHKSLSHELNLQQIPHENEVRIPIRYKGKDVGEAWLDVLVAGRLIAELKSVEALTSVHRAQLIAYLQSTKLPLGLLLNFNVAIMKDGIKRVILSHQA